VKPDLRLKLYYTTQCTTLYSIGGMSASRTAGSVDGRILYHIDSTVVPLIQ